MIASGKGNRNAQAFHVPQTLQIYLTSQQSYLPYLADTTSWKPDPQLDLIRCNANVSANKEIFAICSNHPFK